MALVDYASSSEEEQDDTTNAIAQDSRKRKRDSRDVTASELPPLPSQFLDLYASSTRTSTRDDSSLHEGRKRVTPHIEGNWPTHLYIEWFPGIAEHDLLSLVITTIGRQMDSDMFEGSKIGSLLITDLGAPLPLHISLSRPIGLATGQKDLFLASIVDKVANSGIRPFTVSFRSLDWVSNFKKTRWFLVLRLQRPDGDELNKLLEICNKTCQDYSQPSLYASVALPYQHGKGNAEQVGKREHSDDTSHTQEAGDYSNSFHISIGWTLKQPSSAAIESLKTLGNDEKFERLKKATLRVDAVKAKIGNVITSIPLLPKVVEVGGLFSV